MKFEALQKGRLSVDSGIISKDFKIKSCYMIVIL
jgi:hypothetical protein